MRGQGMLDLLNQVESAAPGREPPARPDRSAQQYRREHGQAAARHVRRPRHAAADDRAGRGRRPPLLSPAAPARGAAAAGGCGIRRPPPQRLRPPPARNRRRHRAARSVQAPGTVAVDPNETRAYEAAQNQRRIGNYQGAIFGFQNFLKQYPQEHARAARAVLDRRLVFQPARLQERDRRAADAGQVLPGQPDGPGCAAQHRQLAGRARRHRGVAQDARGRRGAPRGERCRGESPPAPRRHEVAPPRPDPGCMKPAVVLLSGGLDSATMPRAGASSGAFLPLPHRRLRPAPPRRTGGRRAGGAARSGRAHTASSRSISRRSAARR